MSTLTKWTGADWTGDEAGRRKQKRYDEAMVYAAYMKGPEATGQQMDPSIPGLLATENPEERKRRLRRLQTMMEQGRDPYGDLTLSRPGLLSK